MDDRYKRVEQLCTAADDAIGSGQLEGAARMLAEARRLLKQAGVCTGSYIESLLKLGAAQMRAGNAADAVTNWGEARALLHAAPGNERLAADLGAALADLLRQTGRLRDARTVLLETRGEFQALGQPLRVADTDLSLSVVDSLAGQYAQALEWVQKARTVFAAAGARDMVARCDLNRGAVLTDRGEPRRAMEVLRKAETEFSALGLPKEAGDCVANLGKCLRALGELEPAMDCQVRAHATYEQAGHRHGVASCDLNRGALLLDLGRPGPALEVLRCAADAFAGLPSPIDAVRCQILIGACLERTGQVGAGLAALEKARAEAIRLGLSREREAAETHLAQISSGNAEALQAASRKLSRGVELRAEGRVGEALDTLHAARNGFRRHGDLKGEAHALVNLGAVLGDLGRFDEAIATFTAARKAYVTLGAEGTVAECDVNCAIALAALGRVGEAERLLRGALDCFRRTGTKIPLAKGMMTHGQILIRLARHEEALRVFTEAGRFFEERGLTREAADCDQGRGTALRGLGDRPHVITPGLLNDALRAFERAGAAYRRQGARKAAAGCEMNVGLVLDRLGKRAAALRYVTAAREAFRELGFPFSAADASANLGELFRAAAERATGERRRQGFVEALAHLEEALAGYERLRLSFWNYASRISFGEQYLHTYRAAFACCLELGRLGDALAFCERARSRLLADCVSFPPLPDAATVGEELRRRLESLCAQLATQGVVPFLRDELVRTGVRDNPSPATALEQFEAAVDEVVARMPDSPFTRALQSAEIRHLGGPEEYRGLLPDEASCLLEFAMASELQAFIVTRERGLELVRFPTDPLHRLSKLWDRYKAVYDPALPQPDRAAAVEHTCRELHALLYGAKVDVFREAPGGAVHVETCASLFDCLDLRLERPGRHLIIVPAGHLFLLPLHAAFTDNGPGGGRRYVLEDYRISFVPSAYLLGILQRRRIPERRQALVVGNPQPLPGLPPIPHATAEATWVAQRLRDEGWQVDSLIEEDATKERFLGDSTADAGIRGGRYGHLHLALHGGVGGREGQAQLYFAEVAGAAGDAHLCFDRELTSADLRGTRSVVAAACLTAATDPRGSEYLGIAAAFLQAGVQAYVGTIYPLSDLGSERLVREMYALHLAGADWGEALRRAQLRLARSTERAEGDIPLRHPYHWAAFTATGWTEAAR